jgi:hypothetical protein
MLTSLSTEKVKTPLSLVKSLTVPKRPSKLSIPVPALLDLTVLEVRFFSPNKSETTMLDKSLKIEKKLAYE